MQLHNQKHFIYVHSSSYLAEETEEVGFLAKSLEPFLILHHVGQITQTFGHTICQMSSERRILLLAGHANVDYSTKLHFNKIFSGLASSAITNQNMQGDPFTMLHKKPKLLHTICQMFSERRILLLAGHANVD